MCTEGLQDREWIKLPYEMPGHRHVYHLYVIEVDRRDEMLQHLNDSGTDAKTHDPIAIQQREDCPWGKAEARSRASRPRWPASARRRNVARSRCRPGQESRSWRSLDLL
jgi:hypothetical protein